MKTKLPIRLRTANPEDIGFIFNSWLKSYRSSSVATKVINTIFFAEQHKLIERLLANATVIIACNDNDPSQIFGWAVAERIQGIFAIHYIYVKHSFRRMGIANELIKAFGHDGSEAGIYTHYTAHMDQVAPKYNLLYHPYVLSQNYAKKEPENE